MNEAYFANLQQKFSWLEIEDLKTVDLITEDSNHIIVCWHPYCVIFFTAVVSSLTSHNDKDYVSQWGEKRKNNVIGRIGRASGRERV